MSKTAIYNNQSFSFPDGTSATSMKAALAAMFPELTNGAYREVNGAVEFYVAAQNKSAATAIYNNQSFSFPDGTSATAMKAALAAMFPELTNGAYREVNGAVEFYVAAQNKSAATAIYNNQSFSFPDGTSATAMKAALAAMFPELTNGAYREVNGAVEFYVAAQNKSAATAIYNNQSFSFPDGTSATAMKAALAAMFPELTNGAYREVNGAVEFYVAAQNKSAATAIYNNQSFSFPDGTSATAMKAALAAMFPELTNGAYREVNGAVEFYVAAQNKSKHFGTVVAQCEECFFICPNCKFSRVRV